MKIFKQNHITRAARRTLTRLLPFLFHPCTGLALTAKGRFTDRVFTKSSETVKNLITGCTLIYPFWLDFIWPPYLVLAVALGFSIMLFLNDRLSYDKSGLRSLFGLALVAGPAIVATLIGLTFPKCFLIGAMTRIIAHIVTKPAKHMIKTE